MGVGHPDTISAVNTTTATRKISLWPTLFGVALLGLALYWLHHVIAHYGWTDIVAHMRAIPMSRLVRAALFAAAGYGCLTLYDFLAVRFAGAHLPYPRVALVSFMAYAIGHNVGLNMLSGGAVRLRGYGALGLGPKQMATVIAFGTLTFGLGASVLLGTSLLLDADWCAPALHLPAIALRSIGVLLLLGVVAYLRLTFTRRTPLMLRGHEIPVPRPRIALAQITVACTDLLCAAAVLFVLLPVSTVGFPAFAAIYLIAIAAGILSNLPGGVGVFELVLLSLLRSVPADRLLGALLAYRVIYYLGPFAIALFLLAMHELWLHRGPLPRVTRLLRSYLSAFTPQLAAIAVFGAGAVLLFSGATPGIADRLGLLRDIIPLPVLELSHLLGSAVGVGLLVIANGLYRRLDAAWWLTVWLLGAGIVFSLLKGFDYEEALALAGLLLMLVSARERFRRRASLLDQHFSNTWVTALILVLGASLWLVVFSYRHMPYSHELWWQFAFEATAPRSLRALLLTVVAVAAYGLWRLLRPAKVLARPPEESEISAAAALMPQVADTTGNLALLGDKSLMFNEDRSAFIMYQVSGSSWVAMGDPMGPAQAREALAWEFIEACDAMAVSPVFYQVTPDNLPIYIDLGLSLSKLGEEARVALLEFSLDGAERADLRQSHRRALRDGATFEVVDRDQVSALVPQLKVISDAWLDAKNAGEKRFSLGFFSADYLRRFDCAVVRRAGSIVAFANIWRAGHNEELSVDLMRYDNDAPKGVVDFLMIECMLWGRAQGYRWFNLGMAPLAGLEEHALAPTWHKLGRVIQRFGENFYAFEGLRKYKDKFSPVWRPRYLAAPGGLAMAGVLLDVTALISGGVTKVLKK